MRCLQSIVSLAALVMSFGAALSNTPAQRATEPALEQAAYLAQTTVMTIHDAKISNNYMVLWDLASPSMQSKHTSTDLANSVRSARAKNFDLFLAASSMPHLTRTPIVIVDGKLSVVGFFAARPEHIKFDFVFEAVAGVWRIAHLVIAMERRVGENASPAAR